MEIMEIIKKSIHYPLNDYKSWLTIAIVYLIMGILLSFVVIHGGITAIIGLIICFILGIVIAGYNVSIIRLTINNKDYIPMLDPLKNFIDGIKISIIGIVYYLVSAIIILIIAYPLGFYYNLNRFINTINTTAVAQSDTVNAFVNVSPYIYTNLISNIMVLSSIFMILLVLIIFLMNMSMAIFAETNSMSNALNLSKVIEKMKNIGVIKYILIIVSIMIINLISTFIIQILMLIPKIGFCIGMFILSSYIALFQSKIIGLAYMEDKSITNSNQENIVEPTDNE